MEGMNLINECEGQNRIGRGREGKEVDMKGQMEHRKTKVS